MVLFQVIPKRLLIPEAILNARDNNQSRFTERPRPLAEFWTENCSVVAVMLEKNVAIVVMLKYRVVSFSFSSETIVGISVAFSV